MAAISHRLSSPFAAASFLEKEVHFRITVQLTTGGRPGYARKANLVTRALPSTQQAAIIGTDNPTKQEVTPYRWHSGGNRFEACNRESKGRKDAVGCTRIRGIIELARKRQKQAIDRNYLPQGPRNFFVRRARGGADGRLCGWRPTKSQRVWRRVFSS